MAMTEKTKMVFDYIQANERPEGIPLPEIAAGVGLTVKQVSPIIWTSLKAKKDGSRGDLVTYDKKEVAGEEKLVHFVYLTDEGRAYTE